MSCGTVASAKLLLLSGVGPAPHLNQVLAFGGFIRPGSHDVLNPCIVESKLDAWVPDLLCWEVDADHIPTGHYYRIIRKHSPIKSLRIITP